MAKREIKDEKAEKITKVLEMGNRKVLHPMNDLPESSSNATRLKEMFLNEVTTKAST